MHDAYDEENKLILKRWLRLYIPGKLVILFFAQISFETLSLWDQP